MTHLILIRIQKQTVRTDGFDGGYLLNEFTTFMIYSSLTLK